MQKQKMYYESLKLRFQSTEDDRLVDGYEALNKIDESYDGITHSDYFKGIQIIGQLTLMHFTGKLTKDKRPALVYYPYHGRVACIRALLAHAKVNYENIQISMPEWPMLKLSGKLNFAANLPV